jgi:hypothetical protein
LQVLRGPVVRPDTVAGRQGMINEAESMLNGKPVYTIGAHRTKRESRRNVGSLLSSLQSSQRSTRRGALRDLSRCRP